MLATPIIDEYRLLFSAYYAVNKAIILLIFKLFSAHYAENRQYNLRTTCFLS